MKPLFFMSFFLLNIAFSLSSMHPNRLIQSLVPHQTFYLTTEKERYKFPVPTYYRYILARLIQNNTESLTLPYSWEDVRDIAQTFNDLDQHKLSQAIARCQQNPDLEKKLENLGLQKQLFKPIAFWVNDITIISGPDQQVARLFLQYREELERQDSYAQSKNPTPLVCVSTPSTHTPSLVLITKRFPLIDITIIRQGQNFTVSLSTKDTYYNHIESIEISPNGLFLVVKIDNTLSLINTKTGNIFDSFDPNAIIQAFAITPDNQNILIVTPDHFFTFEIRQNYGQFYSINKNHEYRVSCVAISTDSSFIVTGQENGNIAFYTWDKNGSLSKCYYDRRHYAQISSIIIKADNDTVIVADRESLLSFYSFKQKRLLESRWLNDTDCAVNRMTLINNGNHLLVESINKIVPPFSPQFAMHSALLYK